MNLRAHGRTPFQRTTRVARAGFALLVLCILSFAARGTESAWTIYNAGVEAYTQQDFAGALQRWQDLSIQPLPRRLQQPVWFQLGNAQFRLGEPLEANAPEQAAELWRRSREAYRSALQRAPRDANSLHNLALVDRRLAKLTQRLGVEAYRKAADAQPDPAIDLLRDSTANLAEAATLAPQDAEIRADRERAVAALQERLLARSAEAEKSGDQSASQRSDWSNTRAEEQYREALKDLAEAAHPPAPEGAKRATPPTVAEAEKRVNQKLADLLTRMGQREQAEGKDQAQWNPDEALSHYEAALEHYAAAQEAQPDQPAAKRGEREVRAAMEQLHVNEGKGALEHGKSALAKKSPLAAPSLSEALAHFEAAQQLNPNNAEAQAGAEEARRLLPEAMTLAGQAEMRSGEEAEPQSSADALNHYEEAQSDFQQALAQKPGHRPAEKGLQAVEPKIAKLRQQVAREAEKAAKAENPGNQPAPKLGDLLGQANERPRDRQRDRQRQRARNDPGDRKNYPDW